MTTLRTRVILRDLPEDGSRAATGPYALRSRHTGRLIARIDGDLHLVFVDPGFLPAHRLYASRSLTHWSPNWRSLAA